MTKIQKNWVEELRTFQSKPAVRKIRIVESGEMVIIPVRVIGQKENTASAVKTDIFNQKKSNANQYEIR